MKYAIILLAAVVIAISCNQTGDDTNNKMKPMSILWNPDGMYLARLEVTVDNSVDTSELPYTVDDLTEFKKITGDTILIISQGDTSFTTDVRGDTIVLTVIEDNRPDPAYLDSTVTFWIVIDADSDKTIDSMTGIFYNKNINFEDTTYREGNISCSKQ